jgi:Uncharacterized protein conserved in bacteria (DUF2188)
MKDQDRIVFRRADGTWVNKRVSAERAAGLHDTQGSAAAEAREMLQNSGGGELIIKGLDGRIRAKDTIAPGNDPYPPEG